MTTSTEMKAYMAGEITAWEYIRRSRVAAAEAVRRDRQGHPRRDLGAAEQQWAGAWSAYFAGRAR